MLAKRRNQRTSGPRSQRKEKEVQFLANMKTPRQILQEENISLVFLNQVAYVNMAHDTINPYDYMKAKSPKQSIPIIDLESDTSVECEQEVIKQKTTPRKNKSDTSVVSKVRSKLHDTRSPSKDSSIPLRPRRVTRNAAGQANTIIDLTPSSRSPKRSEAKTKSIKNYFSTLRKSPRRNKVMKTRITANRKRIINVSSSDSESQELHVQKKNSKVSKDSEDSEGEPVESTVVPLKENGVTEKPVDKKSKNDADAESMEVGEEQEECEINESVDVDAETSQESAEEPPETEEVHQQKSDDSESEEIIMQVQRSPSQRTKRKPKKFTDSDEISPKSKKSKFSSKQQENAGEEEVILVVLNEDEDDEVEEASKIDKTTPDKEEIAETAETPDDSQDSEEVNAVVNDEENQSIEEVPEESDSINCALVEDERIDSESIDENACEEIQSTFKLLSESEDDSDKEASNKKKKKKQKLDSAEDESDKGKDKDSDREDDSDGSPNGSNGKSNSDANLDSNNAPEPDVPDGKDMSNDNNSNAPLNSTQDLLNILTGNDNEDIVEQLESSKKITAETVTMLNNICELSSDTPIEKEKLPKLSLKRTSSSKLLDHEKENINSNSESSHQEKESIDIDTKRTEKKRESLKLALKSSHTCVDCKQIFSKKCDLKVHNLQHADKRALSVRVYRAILPFKYNTLANDMNKYLKPRKKRPVKETDVLEVKNLIGKYCNDTYLEPFDEVLDGDITLDRSIDNSSEENELNITVLSDILISKGPNSDRDVGIDESQLECVNTVLEIDEDEQDKLQEKMDCDQDDIQSLENNTDDIFVLDEEVQKTTEEEQQHPVDDVKETTSSQMGINTKETQLENQVSKNEDEETPTAIVDEVKSIPESLSSDEEKSQSESLKKQAADNSKNEQKSQKPVLIEGCEEIIDSDDDIQEVNNHENDNHESTALSDVPTIRLSEVVTIEEESTDAENADTIKRRRSMEDVDQSDSKKLKLDQPNLDVRSEDTEIEDFHSCVDTSSPKNIEEVGKDVPDDIDLTLAIFEGIKKGNSEESPATPTKTSQLTQNGVTSPSKNSVTSEFDTQEYLTQMAKLDQHLESIVMKQTGTLDSEETMVDESQKEKAVT